MSEIAETAVSGRSGMRMRIAIVAVVMSLLGAVLAGAEPPKLQRLADWQRQSLARQIDPGMELRRYLQDGLDELAYNDAEGNTLALTRLVLLTRELRDAELAAAVSERGAHQGRSLAATMQSCFFSQARYFELYAGLRLRGIDDPFLREGSQVIAERYLRAQERGPNNRPLHWALAQAYAMRLYPQSENAAAWQAYAEAVWNDFYAAGDNYEPGYVDHWFPQIIQLGEILDKGRELRSEKMRRMYRRMLDHVSPSGLVVAPGDGHNQSSYVEGLQLAAELTGDPRFLWGAEATLLAGEAGYNTRNNIGTRVAKEDAAEVLAKKFGHLYARGLRAQLPEPVEAVSYQYPDTYRIADRLLLNPARERGNPYVGLYLNDRTNTTFHGHEDNRGEIYHYEVDGKLLLTRSGWTKWPAHANLLVVADPTVEFPFNQTGGLTSGHWYRGSADIRLFREYLDSERWKGEFPGGRFRETGGDGGGFSHTNLESLSGALDEMDLVSVEIDLVNFPRKEVEQIRGHYLDGLSFDRGGVAWYRDYRVIAPSDGPYTIRLADLALAGMAGLRPIGRFDRIPEDMRILHYPVGSLDTGPVELDPRQVIRMVYDAGLGREVMELDVPPGRLQLSVPVEPVRVNLNTEYPRLNLAYKLMSDVRDWLRVPIKVGVNDLRIKRSSYLDHQQGGVLRAYSSEKRDNDTFGTVRYASIWTHDSEWQRDVVLTAEGIMVVVDRFYPGAAADGLQGGPVWQLLTPPESGLNWFDAQQEPEHGSRLLVYFHKERGTQYGVQAQPKLWERKDYAVYAKRRFTAGQQETFISVMIPHARWFTGEQVSGQPQHHGRHATDSGRNGVRTHLQPDGSVRVDWQPISGVGVPPVSLSVSLQADGTWGVTRR